MSATLTTRPSHPVPTVAGNRSLSASVVRTRYSLLPTPSPWPLVPSPWSRLTAIEIGVNTQFPPLRGVIA